MIARPVLGIACLLASAVAAPADILWGVNGHPITAYPGVSVEQQLDFLKDLGMTSYRVNISDDKAMDKLSELVTKAKTLGIDILPVITPGNIDLKGEGPDELYDKARKLAVSLGSEFKDDIRVWELGNEMESYAIIQPCEVRDNGSKYPCEWGPAGGVHALDYYGARWIKVSAVLKGLSDGMTEVDPGIRKAIGTSGWGHVGAFDRMEQDGVDWDISVWHMYGEDPEWAFKKLSRFGRPIWVTELNNPYGSQRSEQQQADGLNHAMTRLRELQDEYKVEAAHIYELLDETYWAPSFEAFMGLVRLTDNPKGGWIVGEPKPSYFMARDLIKGPRPLPHPKRKCDLSDSETITSLHRRQASYGFCMVLGRKADETSQAFWAEALENGDVEVTGMLIKLLQSDEFNRRYATFGLTDRAYISFLYLLLLGRDADPHGLESYAKQLSRGSMKRIYVGHGIVQSSEFKSKHKAGFATATDENASKSR